MSTLADATAAVVAGVPASALRRGLWASGLFATIFIAACASNTPGSGSNDAKNALPNTPEAQAERMRQRATASYNAGDLSAAQAGFEAAALVYESLALAEPQAAARLSAARVMAENAGAENTGAAPALALVQKVLADSAELSTATRITASGRAAALHLQLNQLDAASRQLGNAMALCSSTCEQTAALLILRARLELAQGNAAAALASATQALSAAANDTGQQANALRARAQAQAQLGAHAQVIADAQAALALDRAAGQASRVQLDLQLLAAAHQALGQTELAQRFAQLAARSGQAQQRIERGLP